MSRPFFPLFFKDRAKLQYLSMEQRGELFTALFDYAADGQVPQLDGVAGFAFEVFREGIDTSLAKYEETCQKRKEAAKKGAAARWGNQSENKMPNGIHEMPNASNSMPNNSKNAETEVRSQKQKSEGEAEAEDEAEAEGEGTTVLSADADNVIKDYFFKKFGREPSKEFMHTIGQTDFQTGIICAAIDKSSKAKKPEAYATYILRSWQSEGVPRDIRPVRLPGMPLEPWEQDWLEEYQAMKGEWEKENDQS